MKKFSIFFLGIVLLAVACTDPEKDPFQLDKLKKGSIIALRGQSYANLSKFAGAVDKFAPKGDVAAENFEFEADYLSDDPNSLQEVEIFARAKEGGDRKLVTTRSGSEFKTVAASRYPRATISVPLREILNAIGKQATDFSADDSDFFNDYIYIECDLTLKDGSKVLASSIVNSSLFESAQFYPAHFMRYWAKD